MNAAVPDLANLSDEESNKIKKMLDKGIKIPPQPRALQEIYAHIQSGNYDVRSLAQIISQDPGLTALLFRAARSPVYFRHQPFTSVAEILQTLGFKQAYNLVQGAALASMTQIKNDRPFFEAFWARSQTIAQLAMMIADDRITVCNIFPEHAYLAAIFHDCGVPVLKQRYQTYGKGLKLDSADGWDNLAEEDARFDTDHTVIGYLVGRHWLLPDYICDAIRFHHDMSRLDYIEARTMVAILQLAIQMYHRVMHVSYADWAGLRSDVLGELCIHEDGAEEYIDDMVERFHNQRTDA